MDCYVAQGIHGFCFFCFLKRALVIQNVSLYGCLARSVLVPLYLRIYVVVIRHYAPNAEGLVYLQKAVLSTLAVWNSHMDTVKRRV